jgi:pyruvate/2-oxoacid:ferredoxin oxidoreductase beta subunit
LDELNLQKDKVVLVSGIGQAAKMPQYINTSFFNGLHGRGLPPATAIKACNPELKQEVRAFDTFRLDDRGQGIQPFPGFLRVRIGQLGRDGIRHVCVSP